MPDRRNVLYIRCCDGRSRNFPELEGCLIHEIRLPGGVLFPDLCAHSLARGEQTFEMKIPVGNPMRQRIVQMMNRMDETTALTIGQLVLTFAVDAVMGLKNPTQIYIASHNHCGAANLIGFNEADTHRKLVEYKVLLQQSYPNVDVKILSERHSECGEYHMGHKDITVHAVAA